MLSIKGFKLADSSGKTRLVAQTVTLKHNAEPHNGRGETSHRRGNSSNNPHISGANDTTSQQLLFNEFQLCSFKYTYHCDLKEATSSHDMQSNGMYLGSPEQPVLQAQFPTTEVMQ